MGPSHLPACCALKDLSLHRFILSALVLLSFTLNACAPLTGQNTGAGPLPVVATFSVIADLVQNVGGEHVTVSPLVGAGQDAHTFNPAPADGAALADARLIFENGVEFEGWLNDLYASSGSRATRVVLSDGIVLRAGAHDEDAHTDDAEAEHHAEAHDPHLWHNVENALLMVRTIRDALVSADPAHQADYEANAQAYTAQLQALDSWVLAQVDTLPPERRKLVTTHDTFGYFADRYGFEVLGSVLPTSTEGLTLRSRARRAHRPRARRRGAGRFCRECQHQQPH